MASLSSRACAIGRTFTRNYSATVNTIEAPFAKPSFQPRKLQGGAAAESVRLSSRLGRTGVTYRRYDRKRLESVLPNYEVYTEKGIQDPRLPIP
ncbi:hypothetical protein SARC_04798 [Sphaeroforma arctica JP610]|uniref:Uncharacterized protein n=1 Tax=Sphaeroforma arctica JP610 TaxID=667725 RepID=A0A0L0G278_9EUKA|nr:hypothetical protein SARC_04798 [Sphaeroforma arctica JP610]KNC82931.1 hypothetical protein SARC_04798 [Sphaeroforma arctica JP610]|eukprot:XP_014156833.1 hypothetical protein SARC_04798 [Sphaeroforma arctica JP610]